MYQALYRKWRPKIFDDVIGQEHVTKTLKSEINSGRISHAYLFTGTRGTGKTSCAKIFAKAVNCLSPIDGSPCGKCEICQGIESESILDITEIDAASNNGVENIRSMREETAFAPSRCKYRVYIVDEVHMLSSGAFNAFLKILEEPPEHVIFILATTEIHKIPATILSRCQRFDFYRLTPENIAKRIKYICEQEKIKIDDESIDIIAKSADGAMRDALSILDQCASACCNDISFEQTKSILGITGNEYICDIANAILHSDFKFCIDTISTMHRQSKNMMLLCQEMMEHFRALMIKKITEKANPESQNFSLDYILKALEILQSAYRNINIGSNQKLELEIALIKLCEIASGGETSEKSISNPQKSVKKHIIPEIVKQPEEKVEAISPAKMLTPSSDETFEHWADILQALKNEKSLKSLYIALSNSQAYENENYILIDSDNDLAFELLRKSEHRSTVKKIIKDITGKQYNLGPYQKQKQSKNEPSDPLSDLMKNATQSGIDVKIN